MDPSGSMSRRAFPLDSRCVWIEQQHVSNSCIPRENGPLGPGEYQPQVATLPHVSTPHLGNMRSFPSYYHSSAKSLNNVTSPVASPIKSTASHSLRIVKEKKEDRDHQTIFHGHDGRMVRDPKLRFCTTPGAYLVHEPILDPLAHDGKKHSTKYSFDSKYVPFGERNITRPALPGYAVKDDQIYRRSLDAVTMKEKRFQSSAFFNDTRDRISPSDTPLPTNNVVASKPDATGNALPRRNKFNKHMKFDSSCYKKKASSVLEVTPQSLNIATRSKPFHQILAIPRPHHSSHVPSKAADALRVYV